MKYRYAHPEFFKNWEAPDLLEDAIQIILYGAGRRGAVAAHCLKKKGIDFVCFCDSDEKKQGEVMYGYPVISPEELKKTYPDAMIIVTSIHYHFICRELQQEGFKKIYSSVFLFLEIDFDGFSYYSPEYMARNMNQYFYAMLDKYTGESYLTQVQIPVTLRCTLRCKECNSYVPYATDPQDFDADEILSSVEILLSAYGRIGNVMLYGGEPFIYGDLDKLIIKLSAMEGIEAVTVITNGTILPEGRLLNALKNSSKMLVRISDYGSLSRKKDELVALFEKHQIQLEVTDFKFWNKNPKIRILNETEEELRRKAANCCAIANMFTILAGKLFFCSFSAYHHYLKAVPDYGDNYVELLNSPKRDGVLREEIEKIRRMGIDGLPKKACRFCDFNNFEDNLPVAEQMTGLLRFDKVY